MDEPKSKQKIFIKNTISKSYQKKDFFYPLQEILQTDFKKIDTKNLRVINICLYNINCTLTSPSTPSRCWLEYYLWKYPQSSSLLSDLFVFPFEKYNKKKTVKEIANNILTKLFKKEKSIFNGWIQRKNDVYIFYKYKIPKWTIHYINRNQSTWWISIHEICNSRRVLNFPIHPSVTKIFYENPKLIYLIKSLDKTRIEIPSIVFYGSSIQRIPFAAVFGIRNHRGIAGANYYFGTYNAAVRYAAFSNNYQNITFGQNIKVTNNIGKYLQGGIIRFIAFLGNLKVKLPDSKKKCISMDEMVIPFMDKTGEWGKLYDSIYTGRAKLKNNG